MLLLYVVFHVFFPNLCKSYGFFHFPTNYAFLIYIYIIITVIISFKIETSLQEKAMLQFKIIHDCTVIGYRVQLKNQSQADHGTKQHEKPINPIAFEREPNQHNP